MTGVLHENARISRRFWRKLISLRSILTDYIKVCFYFSLLNENLNLLGASLLWGITNPAYHIVPLSTDQQNARWCFFFCALRPQVNSYGQCGTVSSPNHTTKWCFTGRLAMTRFYIYLLLKRLIDNYLA